MVTFGDRLKQRRTERGLTPQQLAKAADIPYMTVYRLEHEAHRTPRMDIAVKLARVLGVSLDWLCGVYDENKREAAAVA